VFFHTGLYFAQQPCVGQEDYNTGGISERDGGGKNFKLFF